MEDQELNDIFADYEAIRNDGDADANNEQNGDDVAESSQAVAAAIKRRIVRNPRPKLNADRLCGERGIPTLEKHFEKVHFKGKGHEKEDLDTLLSSMEHWAHRLFPSLKFADSLTHIEKLGKKKPVQVCVRKLRLDMPILAQDFIQDNDDDDVQREGDMDVDEPPVSTFDQLMREHREAFPGSSIIMQDDIPMASSASPVFGETSATQSDLPTTSTVTAEDTDITEEQRLRIERNKMLAAERRKSRLIGANLNVTSDTTPNISKPSQDISDDAVPEMVPEINSKQSDISCNGDINTAKNSTVSEDVTDTLSDSNPSPIKASTSCIEDVSTDAISSTVENRIISKPQENISDEAFSDTEPGLNSNHEEFSIKAVEEKVCAEVENAADIPSHANCNINEPEESISDTLEDKEIDLDTLVEMVDCNENI